jgi:hypothetical protein
MAAPSYLYKRTRAEKIAAQFVKKCRERNRGRKPLQNRRREVEQVGQVITKQNARSDIASGCFTLRQLHRIHPLIAVIATERPHRRHSACQLFGDAPALGAMDILAAAKRAAMLANSVDHFRDSAEAQSTR